MPPQTPPSPPSPRDAASADGGGTAPAPRAPTDLRRLLDLVERLRAPDGCPWDRKQTLGDLRAYLVEEAHEAAAAVDRRSWPDLGEELGDLLFQVAFLLRLGEEEGELAPGEVLDGILAKMIDRHPHVFGGGGEDGDGEPLEDAEAVAAAWERRKLARSRSGDAETPSILAGVPDSLPALVAAYRLTQKAAGVGFDWAEAREVLDAIEEETAELREELREELGGGEEPRDPARLTDEVGDLLFSVANLARKLGIDPEAALAGTNAKFRRRFGHVERRLGERLGEAGLEEMDALWREAKKGEREAP